MMTTAIVLCSRLTSSRVPKKVLHKINGLSVLTHLVSRLAKTKYSVIIAVPRSEVLEYHNELQHIIWPMNEDVIIHGSDFIDDPLARINEVAEKFNLDSVIRVTHDKIFLDIEQIPEALKVFKNSKADYLCLPKIIPGTGFEIISKECIKEASSKFKNVEHVSYAVRLVSKNTIKLNTKTKSPDPDLNLLIDFPQDLELLELILSQLGNKATLNDVLKYLSVNSNLTKINCQPLITFYTCAYNAENFIQKAIQSVSGQSIFSRSEYLLIDDFSSDKTPLIMSEYSHVFNNIHWIRNSKNLGLAASSNIALSKARGKYIMRIDADDFLVGHKTVNEMISYIEKSNDEALYPDNHFGEFNKIQKGSAHHHVGGALFDKRAINFVKFTDDLRHYDGLDLFMRARDLLKIGYYEKPTFFYTQHDKSMSKNNMDERETIKSKIMEGFA